MSPFFQRHPKTSCPQTLSIIWFDDLFDLLNSIRNECETNCRLSDLVRLVGDGMEGFGKKQLFIGV
ncbi:hypothetical protein LINPERPRIM_LOCUS9023 [Linum perenne]